MINILRNFLAHPPMIKERSCLLLLLAAGLLLRFTAIIAYGHAPESDEIAYKSMALNLIHGNGIVDNMCNHAMYNVGYPLFVLSPIFFLFGEDLLIVRLANMLLGGVSIILCYMVAREAGAGRVGRLLAAAIWALYLPASIYGVYLAKENLMIPLMLGVVWCALRLLKEMSLKVAVVCGVLFGLLALTGNAALSLVAVVVLAVLLNPTSWQMRLFAALLIFAGAAAVSAPWMIRNNMVIGSPVLNTNGGFNLYLGNNPAATGWFVSVGDTPRAASWHELRKVGEVYAAETLKQDAIAWIKQNPAEFLTLSLKKAIYFWMPPIHKGQGPGSTAESLIRAMWLLQFVLMFLFALGNLVCARLRSKQLLVLGFALICYTGVHMLFYVIFRYREPIMPVLGVMAALAAEYLLAKYFRWAIDDAPAIA